MTYRNNKLNYRQRNNRPQAFWGALVPAAINFVGGLISSSAQSRAQKRAIEEQKRLAQKQLQVSNQNNLSATLNNYAAAQNSYDDTDYNLKYRNGGTRKLGTNSIVITDGGNARKIGNNTFLLRGGSHEDINETGQTGIGINVGGNEIEAEGGEVAQKKNKSLRIFSAQPMLAGGLSPAQAILRGYNKDKIFAAQQRFKRHNHLNDDGSKFANGGKVTKPDYYHWMHQTSNNLKVSPIDSTYDYRAYYDSATPWELANTMYNAKNGHFTDIGKRPNHPTFSNESKYSNSKTPGGTWNGNVFVPAIWQFGNNGNKIRNKYINNTGEGYFDGRHNVYPKNRYGSGGRIKTRIASKLDYNTIPDGGIPGTDSYNSRMRYGLDTLSPLDALSILYEKTLGRFDNKNPNVITGVAPNVGLANPGAFLNIARGARYTRGLTSIKDFKYLGKTVKPSYSFEQTWSLPNNSMIRAQRAKEITKRITTNHAADEARRIRNYNIAKMQAANAEANFSPFTNQYRYANGQPVIINTKGYYTTSPRTIERGAKHMTDGANPFLYTGDISSKAIAKNVVNSAKSNINIPKVNYETVGKTLGYGTAALLPTIGAYYVSKRNKEKDETNKTELDAKGKPLSKYIARPQNKANDKNQVKKDSTTQIPDSIRRPVAKKDSVVTPVFKQTLGKDTTTVKQVKSTTPKHTVSKNNIDSIPTVVVTAKKPTINKKDTTRVDTIKQVKTVPQQKKVVTPQYKGNVTKGNYQLHDGESKTINGVKYTRIGNNIINHKTNVAYVYDKNGNYTGQADYSKVGKNFNDAFDAARAAGRSNFIYNAGKYRNYSTAKEEDAKKEARNRVIGSRRIAKKCGGLLTPRRRYLPGGTANPWDKYKVPNYGGTSPWQLSNKYDVTVPYAITKYDLPIVNVTANKYSNNNNAVKPVVKTLSSTNIGSITTPYLGSKNSFKPSTQDYIGLGIDTLAALGSGLFTRSAYNKLNFDYNLPAYVDESPVAFDTTYHNEAQRANVERNRLNGRNLIQGNTSSAQTALSRMQEGDTNAMMELNKLADEKANKEVELRNQNAANEQQVRARNAAARNQYYQNVAQIKNAALEAKNNAAIAKAQSIGADFSGLAQAWSNFATSVENRYDSRQNQIAMIVSANNPNVTQTALRMGYDFAPETLAGLYNTATDANLKQLILSRLSTRDRIKYGIKQ